MNKETSENEFLLLVILLLVFPTTATSPISIETISEFFAILFSFSFPSFSLLHTPIVAS
jgi:hypothetical protein